MMGYFKLRRRKVGVITLVVACVFVAGWVRSNLADDRISFDAFERTISIVSASGGIACESRKFSDIWDALQSRRGSTWDRGVKVASPPINRPQIIPYWSIVIPLTLLSAWLLLSKPRAKPTTPANP